MDTDEKYSAEAEMASKVPWWTSCRVTLALVASFGSCIFYILRFCLSIAIVCMTRDAFRNETLGNYSYGGNSSSWETGNYSSSSSSSSSCGLLAGSITGNQEGEFTWSKQLRGNLLGSFFWGYIITQVPGGYLASRFGPKHVYGTAMLISVLTILLTPVAARWDPYAVMALRIIMGMVMGVCMPSIQAMWGRWAPPLERSKLVAFSHAGLTMGAIVAMSVSGLLCSIPADNGWPFIFYIYGVISLVWWVGWNLLVYNSPAEHPRITAAERDYIIKTTGKAKYDKRNHKVPWRSILTSPATWAVVAGHSCNNWGLYTIISTIPMYMKEVLRFDIKQNGALSALPFVVMYFVQIGAGFLADYLRKRRILSTVAVRKIWEIISTILPSACMLGIGFMSCEQRYGAVSLLVVAVGFTAFGRAAWGVNHIDVAPQYAGILYALSNMGGTISGMISPPLVGLLTPNGTQAEWQKVFFICAGVYLAGALTFGVFARGTRQEWDKGERNTADVSPLQEGSVDGTALKRNGVADDATLKSGPAQNSVVVA